MADYGAGVYKKIKNLWRDFGFKVDVDSAFNLTKLTFLSKVLKGTSLEKSKRRHFKQSCDCSLSALRGAWYKNDTEGQ